MVMNYLPYKFHSIIEKYHAHDMNVKLINLSPDCRDAVQKAELVLEKSKHK